MSDTANSLSIPQDDPLPFHHKELIGKFAKIWVQGEVITADEDENSSNDVITTLAVDSLCDKAPRRDEPTTTPLSEPQDPSSNNKVLETFNENADAGALEVIPLPFCHNERNGTVVKITVQGEAVVPSDDDENALNGIATPSNDSEYEGPVDDVTMAPPSDPQDSLSGTSGMSLQGPSLPFHLHGRNGTVVKVTVQGEAVLTIIEEENFFKNHHMPSQGVGSRDDQNLDDELMKIRDPTSESERHSVMEEIVQSPESYDDMEMSTTSAKTDGGDRSGRLHEKTDSSNEVVDLPLGDATVTPLPNKEERVEGTKKGTKGAAVTPEDDDFCMTNPVDSPDAALPPHGKGPNSDSYLVRHDVSEEIGTSANDESREASIPFKTEESAQSTSAPLSASEPIPSSNDDKLEGDLPQAVPLPANGEASQDGTSTATTPATAFSDDKGSKDHTTNRYKVNGIIRRPCICENSDECREMMAFWCEAVDDQLNPRDPCRAGYMRLPVYHPEARTPIQHYKNFLRLSFIAHLRPLSSAQEIAKSRRQGKNTAEYVALHHFPREFLKKVGGKGLKIDSLDESTAKKYKLTENDKIKIVRHRSHNRYFAPPCYKWPNLVSEYVKAVAAAGFARQQMDSPSTKRERACNAKPKILCLGMSKACVESQMDMEGYNWNILDETSATVKQAVELVCRGVLTEMDARDLARCRAMEVRHKVDAYTVSQENGSQYDKEYHLHANFNRSNFCGALERAFKKPTFRQIILDYFWIPSGSWMSDHWSKSFFRITLPSFVKYGLLEFPPESKLYDAKDPLPSTEKLGKGCIYLPFCLHVMKQLIANVDEIKLYFKITMLYKNELEEHALWSGTSTIDPVIMQGRFGKNIAQEEIYCTFTPRDVSEAMEDEHITKEEMTKVLRGIEDFADVRMVRLTPLAKHNPRFKRIKRYVDEVGGFVGLLDPKDVQRGFDSLLPASKVTESSSSEEIEEEEEEEEEESSSSEEEVQVAPPPPIRKKPVAVKRKRQSKPKPVLAPPPRPVVVAKPAPRKRKKIMFEVLPDLETYCSLGLEGNEKVADYYSLPERKRRRRRCDIEDYHFGPERETATDEDPAAAVQAKPRPSLLSKLTLSFHSGYDTEQFWQRRRLGYETVVATNADASAQQESSSMSSIQEQPTTATTVDNDDASDGAGYLMLLAAAANGEARRHEEESTSDSSTRYLTMLACTAEMPGVQRLLTDCKNAIESYTTILVPSSTNESLQDAMAESSEQE